MSPPSLLQPTRKHACPLDSSAGRLLAGIVYGASAADTGVLALVVLGLGGVGLLASYLPARRATKIDPLAALREE